MSKAFIKLFQRTSLLRHAPAKHTPFLPHRSFSKNSSYEEERKHGHDFRFRFSQQPKFSHILPSFAALSTYLVIGPQDDLIDETPTIEQERIIWGLEEQHIEECILQCANDFTFPPGIWTLTKQNALHLVLMLQRQSKTRPLNEEERSQRDALLRYVALPTAAYLEDIENRIANYRRIIEKNADQYQHAKTHWAKYTLEQKTQFLTKATNDFAHASGLTAPELHVGITPEKITGKYDRVSRSITLSPRDIDHFEKIFSAAIHESEHRVQCTSRSENLKEQQEIFQLTEKRVPYIFDPKEWGADIAALELQNLVHANFHAEQITEPSLIERLRRNLSRITPSEQPPKIWQEHIKHHPDGPAISER